jgi:hypothetical protein
MGLYISQKKREMGWPVADSLNGIAGVLAALIDLLLFWPLLYFWAHQHLNPFFHYMHFR